MKKLFALLLFSALAVSCGSDSDDGQQNICPGDKARFSFTGDVTVTPSEGSPFAGFTDPQIVFDLTGPGDPGKFTLTMNRIKFVEQMPMRVTFDIRELTLAAQDDGSAVFSVAETLPYFNGEPYDPQGDGTYRVRNLSGRIVYGTQGTPLSLRVAFDCYTMHVQYSGTYNK